MSTQTRTLDAVLREDLSAFIAKTFNYLNPSADYVPNWHIDAIAHQLQRAASGEIDRLIITLPPRHLKSISASVAFPAWILGSDPSARVICVSYSNELAGKMARDCRSVIESRWYRDLYKGTRISRRKNTEKEIATTRHGGRLATSIEGTLTGRGGRFVIIDDPIKPDSAMSEAERQNVNEWFKRVVYTRLDDRSNSAIIIVMQRVHEDDLVGHVLDLDDWTVLDIPAVAEQQSEYRTGLRPLDVYTRQPGELIDPRRLDEAELARLKSMLGNFNFAAQYQQNPIPIEGNLVKQEWFRRYDMLPVREEMDAVVLSWDTATAAGELNDYSVCTVWGVVGQNYYLMDVVRKKLDYPDLRNLAFEMVQRHDADIVLVEDVTTGRSLLQDLRRGLHRRVIALPPRGDKVMRFSAQSAVIEQGRVFIPKDAHWLNEFTKELLGFPGTKHDDQVDSVEMFLRFADGRRGMAMTGSQRGPDGRPVRPRRESIRRRPFNARRYIRERIEENAGDRITVI